MSATSLPLEVVVLAAGKGTRMRSRLPKVLHPIGGRPMISHVLDTVTLLRPHAINLVVGHGADEVEKVVSAPALRMITQTEQLGTGHAVQQVQPQIAPDSVVLILYGDVPLISRQTLENLVALASSTSMALLTGKMADPTGYGRVVRDKQGQVTAIVEQKDASTEQLTIKEINSGVMAVYGQHLLGWLPRLRSDNAQGEYYLTDIIAMADADAVQVQALCTPDLQEIAGVNDRQQQAELERVYQQRQARALMAQGLTLADPNRFDLRGSLVVGTDCTVDVNCIFEGDNVLGDGVTIGPNCLLKNARIGDNTRVEANSILEDAVVASDCSVGPFARVRPGTELARGAKVGNFVETKKALIGHGSKVNHLSYIGDATVGDGVNIGAGTITCNYDGVNKHRTMIGDGVFVGSNTALVAPVNIGKDATIAAGSTVTGDVESGQLSVARSRQRNIDGWQRPAKKEQS